MDFVKKMAFPLMLVSGLSQQTFGVFENFKEVMMDSIKNNNSSVVIGALAGAGVGSIIYERSDNLFSTGLSMPDKVKEDFKAVFNLYNNESYSDFESQWNPQNCKLGEVMHSTNLSRIPVTGDIILEKNFYSLTQDRICKSKFEGEIVKRSDGCRIENLKVTQPEETFARSWTRTLAVLGFTTGIGALIGYQLKKN